MDNSGTTDTNMTVLDIMANSGITTVELQSKWHLIETDRKGLYIEPRWDPQTMELLDGKTMVISGGFGSQRMNYAYQTLAFNGETQSWSAFANYMDGPDNRQM